MTVVVYVLSLLLVAEFVFAPLNLWSGRTSENWIRFTGLSTRLARTVAAPVTLTTAVLIAAGLLVRPLGIAGAAAAVAVSLFYLARLAHPARRAADGVGAFLLFGALAGALLAIQLGLY